MYTIEPIEVDADLITFDSEVEGATEEDYFRITRIAWDEIIRSRELNDVSDSFHLRIKTRPFGLAGRSFSVEFDADVHEFDRLLGYDNVSFVIDFKTIFYLMGSTMNFVESNDKKGFVFSNPHSSDEF